eukprot:GILJ01008497.1.p1 GENE.GILJ01008497.1~~GILJ01008497.1.p1  ORF type:complete len:326 (+),score=54.59 GILJ01008497.1:50-979(+)
MAASRNQHVSEMSKRLLEGWAMLAETCPGPNCAVPLLKNKAGEIYCVSCKMNCVLESQVTPNMKIVSPDTPAPPAASVTNVQDVAADEEDGYGWTAPTPEEKAQMEKKRKRTDQTSSKIGQKLLMGWALLSESCSLDDCGTPLMRDKKGVLVCLGCDKLYTKNADGSIKPVETAPVATSSEPPAKKQTVETAAAAATTAGSTNNVSPAATADPMASSNLQSSLPSGTTSASHPMVQMQTGESISLPNVIVRSPQQVWDDSIVAVYHKMEAARQVLQQTTDMDKSRRLLGYLVECAKTLETLESLSKNRS